MLVRVPFFRRIMRNRLSLGFVFVAVILVCALVYWANAVREGLIEAGRERTELRQSAFDLMADIRGKRVGRVGFVDFLYFSIGVSTTTTFGDIIPNHTVTRFVVTLQLLASIIIVGLFVNSLSAEIATTWQPPTIMDSTH
jgi:hypothetical protein